MSDGNQVMFSCQERSWDVEKKVILIGPWVYFFVLVVWNISNRVSLRDIVDLKCDKKRTDATGIMGVVCMYICFMGNSASIGLWQHSMFSAVIISCSCMSCGVTSCPLSCFPSLLISFSPCVFILSLSVFPTIFPAQLCSAGYRSLLSIRSSVLLPSSCWLSLILLWCLPVHVLPLCWIKICPFFLLPAIHYIGVHLLCSSMTAMCYKEHVDKCILE